MTSCYFLALPALLMSLSACSGGEEGGNTAAPAPQSTAPAPRTPVMQITPEPGNQAEWMAPPSNADDPTRAPFGNLLDDPMVRAPSKR